MRKWMVALAVLGMVFGSSLARAGQRFEAHWYQPRLLPDAAAALDRVQALSPRFVPAGVVERDFYVLKNYTLFQAEGTSTGLQLAFRKGRTGRQALSPWSAEAEAYTSARLGKDAFFSTIVYHEISYLELWRVSMRHGHYAWCVSPVENLTARNSVLCLASQEEAQSLADALATLATAAKSVLAPPLGMWAEPGEIRDRRSKILQTGWEISRVDPEGPPTAAGLQPGDLIYKVNGLPFPGSGAFFSAFRSVAWPDASSGDVRVDFLRGAVNLSVVVHYPVAAE
jgi:hypothetical protein